MYFQTVNVAGLTVQLDVLVDYNHTHLILTFYVIFVLMFNKYFFLGNYQLVGIGIVSFMLTS